MRKVVRHKIVDFYRMRRPEIREADLVRIQADLGDSFQRIELLMADSATTPSEALERAERWLQLSRAIERLPAEYRDVLVRKDLAGWKLREIAREKCCSVGVVAGLLRRGREQLTQELSKYE